MKHNIARYRELTEKILHHLPKIFSGLSIDYFVLMPSHLHIIFVFQNVRDRFARPVSLGEVVRTYKALVTKETKIKNFWQRNYYEHVIRNEEALLKIRGYIQNELSNINKVNKQRKENNAKRFFL